MKLPQGKKSKTLTKEEEKKLKLLLEKFNKRKKNHFNKKANKKWKNKYYLKKLFDVKINKKLIRNNQKKEQWKNIYK